MTASMSTSAGSAPRSRMAGDLAGDVVGRAAITRRRNARRRGSSKPAGDAEVEQGDAPVGLDEEVAAVQVAVEDAVEHRSLEEGDEPGPQHRLGVDAGGPHGLDVVPGEAVEPLHDEHPAGHERRVGARHDDGAAGRSRRGRGRRRACSRPRGGSRAPRRSSRRTARSAPAGWPARRPGSGRRGAARASSSPPGRAARAWATVGRCTLTTTSSPVRRRAAWTWAIEAAASGRGSNLAKTCSRGRPRSASTIGGPRRRTRPAPGRGAAGTRPRAPRGRSLRPRRGSGRA